MLCLLNFKTIQKVLRPETNSDFLFKMKNKYLKIFHFRWIVLQTMSGSLWGSFHVIMFNIIIFLLFMAHARAVFTDPGIVPLPNHRFVQNNDLIYSKIIFCRIDFSDSHDGGSMAPKEDWTICTKYDQIHTEHNLSKIIQR